KSIPSTRSRRRNANGGQCTPAVPTWRDSRSKAPNRARGRRWPPRARRPGRRAEMAPATPPGTHDTTSIGSIAETDPTGWGDLPLAQNHVRELIASAIPPSVAKERGYRTVTVKRRLGELGFRQNQQNAPGLLVPIHNLVGEPVGHLFKPDSPRTNPQTGKV